MIPKTCPQCGRESKEELPFCPRCNLGFEEMLDKVGMSEEYKWLFFETETESLIREMLMNKIVNDFNKMMMEGLD